MLFDMLYLDSGNVAYSGLPAPNQYKSSIDTRWVTQYNLISASCCIVWAARQINAGYLQNVERHRARWQLSFSRQPVKRQEHEDCDCQSSPESSLFNRPAGVPEQANATRSRNTSGCSSDKHDKICRRLVLAIDGMSSCRLAGNGRISNAAPYRQLSNLASSHGYKMIWSFIRRNLFSTLWRFWQCFTQVAQLYSLRAAKSKIDDFFNLIVRSLEYLILEKTILKEG
jgi:hypothetical protein